MESLVEITVSSTVYTHSVNMNNSIWPNCSIHKANLDRPRQTTTDQLRHRGDQATTEHVDTRCLGMHSGGVRCISLYIH